MSSVELWKLYNDEMLSEADRVEVLERWIDECNTETLIAMGR